MSIVRLWFAVSAALLLMMLLYAFAPLLLVVLVVAAGFGALSAAIVSIARRVERSRARQPDA
jgi:hypothetical protein